MKNIEFAWETLDLDKYKDIIDQIYWSDFQSEDIKISNIKILALISILGIDFKYIQLLFWEWDMLFWVSFEEFNNFLHSQNTKQINILIFNIKKYLNKFHKENLLILPSSIKIDLSAQFARWILTKIKYRYSLGLILSLGFFNINQVLSNLTNYVIEWTIKHIDSIIKDIEWKTDSINNILDNLPSWLLNALSKFWLNTNTKDYKIVLNNWKDTLHNLSWMLTDLSKWVEIYYYTSSFLLILMILYSLFLLKWMNKIGKISDNHFNITLGISSFLFIITLALYSWPMKIIFEWYWDKIISELLSKS